MRRSSAPESTSTVMMVAVMPEVRLLPLGMRRRPGEPLFTLVCFPVGQTGYILDTGSVITPIRIDGAQAFYNSLDMCLWLRIDGVLDRGGLGGGLSGDCHREGANCQGSHDAGDDFLHGHNVSLRRGHLQRGAGSRCMSLTRAATCCAHGPVGCSHGRKSGLLLIICSSVALGRTRCHEDCSDMRGW